MYYRKEATKPIYHIRKTDNEMFELFSIVKREHQLSGHVTEFRNSCGFFKTKEEAEKMRDLAARAQ